MKPARWLTVKTSCQSFGVSSFAMPLIPPWISNSEFCIKSTDDCLLVSESETCTHFINKREWSKLFTLASLFPAQSHGLSPPKPNAFNLLISNGASFGAVNLAPSRHEPPVDAGTVTYLALDCLLMRVER